MKPRFPIAALLLSASPFLLAQAQEAAQPAPKKDAAAEDMQRVEIVATGTRGAQRTMTDTPLPVDIISAKDLTKTGQLTLDKAMQTLVPSFNTVQTPVNDATSLLDPYEIRNMGPSRVLILINGKRKNMSSLVYTQTSPGRGESGADISAIPTDAIKRMDVLRDGASAQYGSDAIAGVVNIILKDGATGGAATARAGMTHEHDGKTGSFSLNQGLDIGGQGFFNYTLEASHVGLSNRPGVVSAKGEAGDFGADLQKDVLPFLAKHPDAGNINGAPKTVSGKGLFNMRYDFSDNASFYANGAYVHKDVHSYANYRNPYWRPTDYGLLHAAGTPYEGYVPDFIGKLDDYNATAGVKWSTAGWDMDLSLTTGGNEQKYVVDHTVNRGMQQDYLDKKINTPSPTRFDAGAVKFNHYVLNYDASKQIDKSTTAYFGTEIRHENYEVIAGEPASYYGAGADSYAGNSPRDSGSFSRSNYGAYFGGTFDLSKDFNLDATGRYEKYSDFGSATVWKLSSRYKLSDGVSLRASGSTGFRAPSLAQIVTQKAQYSFVAGGAIQVSGLINNASAQALGVAPLKAEKSDNITFGLGLNPDKNTSITIDYYNIKVKDRIVLGKEIVQSDSGTTALDQLLKKSGFRSVSFFVNAMDSRTDGIDYVASRKNIPLADGKLTLNLSGNYTLKNERIGAVRNPGPVAAAGQSVLDATQEALIFTSRPKFKTIFGGDWEYRDMTVTLNNTVYGPTKFRNAGMDENLSLEFKTKTVSDLSVNYQLAKNQTFTFNINNMFNVTPSWGFKALNAKGQAILDSKTPVTDPGYAGLLPVDMQFNAVTFNGRYSMVSYDGSHFSQLGRIFNVSYQYRF
ncbi:TonB-dependent siderophore receptor [Massilia sp. TS11]|uniref:TonB-dependent receptor plug domain-containing protein n=1 Tax=Massilia sp. TS11 TaxID=2908003 RepID=UPI001EDA4E34|nr:TonB-dependent receptor [Massilia sp. TS11]MCG2586709.1 TonB-dependent receptor [Massilia sp. TS11]